MAGKQPVTVLIAAKNEEANIGRCLEALSPALRVIVIDSHSQDDTAGIARRAGAEVVPYQYRGGYPKKRQWALDHLDIRTEWIFLVDADEVVPQALWAEIAQAIVNPEAADAYLITKGFHFLGRRFRFGGFSHAAVLLFRVGKARFEQIIDDPPDALDMEIHERLMVNGRVGRLRTPLIHEDFKGLAAYLDRHNRYSTWEARIRKRFLKIGRWGKDPISANLWGDDQQRRRFLKLVAVRIPMEPQLWFAYHFLWRLGFLEGRAGLIASRIRATHFSQVRAKLYELQLHERQEQRLTEPVQQGMPSLPGSEDWIAP